MAEAKIGAEVISNAGDHLPYPPSWVDRLIDWVRNLPLPAWAFYLLAGSILTLLIVSVAWAEGFLGPGSFLLLRILSATTGVYMVAMLHYLDDSAANALRRFRPVLTVDDAGYERLFYQFTTMPRRPALIAGLLGALYALFTLSTFGTSDPSALGWGVSLVQTTVVTVTFLISYPLVGVAMYHTIHQLRLVNEIYTHHTRINLFQPGPLYALSRLAARTAVGLTIPTYLWSQVGTESSVGEAGIGIYETGLYAVLIALTFVWPLMGAHGLLEKEKERLKEEVSRRIETTIADLHSRVDTGEMHDRDALKDTLDGLVAEQGVIDKLRTWPWQTQTVSGLGVALLLPIIIWVIQRVLERLGI